MFPLQWMISMLAVLATVGFLVGAMPADDSAGGLRKNYRILANSRMTWTDAMIHCIRHNMSLASFASPEEAARAREAAAGVIGILNWFWTGGAFNEYWMWIPSGRPITGYLNWANGYPDGDRFLVLQYKNGTHAEWKSYPRDSLFYAMCQFYSEPATTACTKWVAPGTDSSGVSAIRDRVSDEERP